MVPNHCFVISYIVLTEGISIQACIVIFARNLNMIAEDTRKYYLQRRFPNISLSQRYICIYELNHGKIQGKSGNNTILAMQIRISKEHSCAVIEHNLNFCLLQIYESDKHRHHLWQCQFVATWDLWDYNAYIGSNILSLLIKPLSCSNV